MDDTDLLRDYLSNGSEEAFSELVHRHINLVYGAALRRLDGDAHAAADVAQVVFETLARKASSLVGHPTLTGWLFATTHFIAARTRRGQQRRRMREQEAQLMNEIMSDSNAESQWAELRPVLEEAILELEACDREVVMLRYFEERPFAEIGALLRLTEDTARKRVERALEKLEQLLAKQGITSTAGALALALSNQPLVAAPPGMAAAIAQQALVTLTAKGAGAGIGIFMLTSKTGVGIAAVVLLAVGAAFYEANEARSARQDLTRVTGDREAMAAKLRHNAEKTLKAEARAQAAEMALQGPRAGAVSQPSTVSPTRVEGATNAVATRESSLLDKVNADSNYLRASLGLHRSTLRFDFGALYHRLGLSPEKIAGFEDSLIDQAERMTEVRLAALAQGVAPTDPVLESLRRPIIAETYEKIRRLVGPEGFQIFQDYTKVVRARSLSVDPLAGSLYYTNAPLTAAQADQLVGVIGANTAKYGMSGVVSTGNETDWPKVIAQAQAFLSPLQIETLRALRKRVEAQQEMQEVAAKVQQALTARPAVSATKPPESGED